MTHRCILLIDTKPGLESPLTGKGAHPPRGLVDLGLAYRSIGFTLTGERDDDHRLAATLRELADMLDASKLPEPAGSPFFGPMPASEQLIDELVAEAEGRPTPGLDRAAAILDARDGL